MGRKFIIFVGFLEPTALSHPGGGDYHGIGNCAGAGAGEPVTSGW